jgi:ATP-dependent protease ClpP protease subunit
MKTIQPVKARPYAKSKWLYVRNSDWNTWGDDDNDGDTDLKPIFPADPSKPVELLIIGQIGYDWWSNSGVALQEFLSALASIPPDREITIGINSEGGNVQDGLGIYNAIRARSDKITCRVDGYACSIASVLAVAGGTTVCPKTSVWMIHDPWSMAQGNADDMRKAADMLEAHAETLLAAYCYKTGKSADEIRAIMKAETWLSGEKAAEFGFANLVDFVSSSPDQDEDEGIEARVIAMHPRAKTELLKISARHKAIADVAITTGGSTSAQENQNTKGHMTNNSTVPTAATTPPVATPQTDPPRQPAATLEEAKIMARLLHLENQAKAEKASRITAVIDAAIMARKIPVADRAEWIALAESDERVIARVHSLPEPTPGTHEVNVTSPDVRDIGKGIEVSSKASESWKRGDMSDWQSVISAGMESATIFAANEQKLKQWAQARWNGQMIRASSTNTIDSNIQRTVILNDILRAFAKKITPLSAFSTVYNNVALQGTDIVSVPYYPLSTTASTDFVAGTGYTTLVDTNDSAKAITINKRKFQSFTYSSSILRRQPYFNVMMNLALKAEQLGVDMWTDVLSVITVANYGAASVTRAYNAFDYENIVDLSTICNQADWPEMGRSLFLDSAYDGNARKDLRFVSALNSGSTETLREGVIARAVGYDIYQNPRIPTNSENLVGFAAFQSGIVSATSPIEPAPGVRQLLVRFELVVDPRTGVGFTYRHGGNATTDEDQEVIEVAYGYAKGEGAAIKRITSA